MPTDPARARAVFLRVARETDSTARAFVLSSECGGDIDLRSAVESLLQSRMDGEDRAAPDSDSGSTHVGGIPPPGFSPSVGGGASAALFAGRYRLEQKLGEGGMGEVWAAEQQMPVMRPVALKLIKAGLDSRCLLAR